MLSAGDFEWDEYFWKTRMAVGTRGGDEVVDVVFAPEGRGDEPLSDGEVSLVQWFADDRTAVLDVVLAAVLGEYPSLQAQYEQDYSPEDRAGGEAVVKGNDVGSIADLRALVGVTGVNVHGLFAGDVPYVGVELECTWDPEHGLGVLTHGTRVVEVGGADTAILLWIARRDAEANHPNRP